MAPAGLFAPSGQKISEKSGGAVVDCGVEDEEAQV